MIQILFVVLLAVANPTDDFQVNTGNTEIKIVTDEDIIQLISENDPSTIYYFPDEKTAEEKCEANRGVITLKDGNRMTCSTNLSSDEKQNQENNLFIDIMYFMMIFFMGYIIGRVIYLSIKKYRLDKEKKGDWRSR